MQPLQENMLVTCSTCVGPPNARYTSEEWAREPAQGMERRDAIEGYRKYEREDVDRQEREERET
jgi:hypothetical protein